MSVIDHSLASGEQAWDPAPGVDIVMTMPDGVSETVLDGRTLKIIGALHRRFWARRRELLLHHARAGDPSPSHATMTDAPLLANLVGDDAQCWDGRIGEYQKIASAVCPEASDGAEGLVAIRGWEETEPGALVDGRAVPGCIFDLVVSLMIGADAFRKERTPFAVLVPAAADDEEAKLWSDLIDLAHDRSGIDRGTVRIETR